MFKKILIALAVVIVVLLVVVALQPSAFVVERSVLIDAPPEAVYPRIANLRAMNEWSPWIKMDPQIVVQYEGPESGVGARSSWDGPQMGKGRLTVTAVDPDRSVDMLLEMITPFEGTNQVVFTLEPKPAGTQVTWHMDGHNGFIGKAMGLILSMDKMVGEPFAEGLAALKTLAESAAQKSAAS